MKNETTIMQEFIKLHENLMYNTLVELGSAIDLFIKLNVRDNLKDIGYEFNSDDEYFNFIKSRITQLQTISKPSCYKFYLDFVDNGEESHGGTLIGVFSYDVNIK